MSAIELSNSNPAPGTHTANPLNEAYFDDVQAWEAAVEQSCAPLRIRLDADCQLNAGLVEQQFGTFRLSRVTSVPCSCEHNRQHITQSPDDAFLYSLQLQGEGRLSQGERSVTIRSGDGVLYDCARPFHWDFSSDLQQLVLRLPRDLFRGRVKNPDKCTALRVTGAHGVGRLLGTQMRLLLDERSSINRDIEAFVHDSTLDLLSGVLSDLSNQLPGPASNLQLYHLNRAYAYITEHVRQPGLSPEVIARGTGISVRYLHQLFHGTGTTVARYLQDMRLDGCARELSSLSSRAHSISDLAYAWGFENSAHFSRVFRNRFQLSAREYRARYGR